MTIGALVKQHITQIFSNCHNEDGEIDRLLNPEKSKEIFGLNFPFCIELENIEPKQSRRYWVNIYAVKGKRVRVTNEWKKRNRLKFEKYLEAKGIKRAIDSPVNKIVEDPADEIQSTQSPPSRSGRYKGNHIGNAQNSFIRNILSNLGSDTITREHWDSTKADFKNKCAYCCSAESSNEKLIMEHAIPINKKSLGEHRLGNLVPSCKQCNAKKSNKDFREYLGNNRAAIEIIEEHMISKGYKSLDDHEQMQKVLDEASKEIATLAEKYIKKANDLLFQNPEK